MITPSSHQTWLFYSPLAQQAALLKDDLLDPVDLLLDDPALVDLVRQCLTKRSPSSTRTGRRGMAPDRLLRCCVMKHLKGWSFRALERELRSNLVYRRFTHFDADITPEFTVFSRSFALLSPAVTAEIHQRVVRLACEYGVAQGEKIRTDTTVVESNVHYPTDSSLLGDGIRVLSRSLQRIADECKTGAVEVVHHARAVKSSAGNQPCRQVPHRGQPAADAPQLPEVVGSDSRRRATGQPSGATVGEGTVESGGHSPGSSHPDWPAAALSSFGGERDPANPGTSGEGEPPRGGQSVEPVRAPHRSHPHKGKAHKPNEFGRLVRIDEVENGIVSGYQVLVGNPPDSTSWMPAIEQHQASFGRVPEMATGDRGFFSAKNEREAEALGVKKVALPARGRLSAKRAKQQKQRWFRRALRWRAGIEATMSTLKHPFSMARATYKGGHGFERYVGWCVITKNLFSIARYQQRRRDHDQVS